MSEKGKINIWMPVYIGDYLRETGHLTTEQHGGYFLMKAHYWVHGPIPDEAALLAAVTRLGPEKWEQNSTTLRALFKKVDGHLLHEDIEADLERARENRESLSRRGKRGAEVRWKNRSSQDASANGPANASANAQEMPGDAPSPSSSPSPLEASSTSSAESEKLALQAALIWNDEMDDVDIPNVRLPLADLRKKRVCNLITKWLGGSLNQWRDYLRQIKSSWWLTGQCPAGPEYDKPFLADFDWAIIDTKMQRVLEGSYKNEIHLGDEDDDEDDVDDVDDGENEDLYGDD